jgi:hypothetical protein
MTTHRLESTPQTTEAVIDLVPPRPVASIHAQTPAGRITFGFDGDLNVAIHHAISVIRLR